MAAVAATTKPLDAAANHPNNDPITARPPDSTAALTNINLGECMRKKIIGVLLAAGHSTRFGESKQSFLLPNGREMALQSALNLQQAVDEVVVVLRAEHAALQAKLLAHGCTCLVLAQEQAPMGYSIATAVQATVRPDVGGWLIALADMPYIATTSLSQMAMTLAQPNTLICAPTYQGQRGHPVGFHASLATALSQLATEEGAKTVLAQHRDHITLIEVDDANVVYDVDEKSQLQ